MKIKPIKPEDVTVVVPDGVIEAFNHLIQQHWNGKQAHFRLQEAIEQAALETELTPNELIDKGYMDVEPLYIDAGWNVVFDQPGYNETYPATFTFSKP